MALHFGIVTTKPITLKNARKEIYPTGLRFNVYQS